MGVPWVWVKVYNVEKWHSVVMQCNRVGLTKSSPGRPIWGLMNQIFPAGSGLRLLPRKTLLCQKYKRALPHHVHTFLQCFFLPTLLFHFCSLIYLVVVTFIQFPVFYCLKFKCWYKNINISNISLRGCWTGLVMAESRKSPTALCRTRCFYFVTGKASLLFKKVFSSTGVKICSLVCTRFPETGTLSVQELRAKFGHNS